MLKKEMIPPYKPLLDTSDDTKHFDMEIQSIPIESPPHSVDKQGSPPTQVDNNKSNNHFTDNSALDNDEFDGFTFEA